MNIECTLDLFSSFLKWKPQLYARAAEELHEVNLALREKGEEHYFGRWLRSRKKTLELVIFELSHQEDPKNA